MQNKHIHNTFFLSTKYSVGELPFCILVVILFLKQYFEKKMQSLKFIQYKRPRIVFQKLSLNQFSL